MKKLYTLFTIAAVAFGFAAKAQCSVTFTYTTNGLTINATATGVGTAQLPAYGWDWGDTQITLNQQTASHTYSASGTYNVCVTFIDVFDTASCNATSCQQVTVGSSGIISNQPQQVSVNASPNPLSSKTVLTLTNTQPTDVSVVVYNTVGQKVATVANEKMNSGIHLIEWNAFDVPAGVYFIQTKAGDIVKTIRVIKQ